MKHFALFALLFTLTVSCSSDESEICDAIINSDVPAVRDQFSEILDDLPPLPTATDDQGHADNLDNFISTLNASYGCLAAELVCYACIKTLPPQSEIVITVDNNGEFTMRVADISTPKDQPMTLVDLHDF